MQETLIPEAPVRADRRSLLSGSPSRSRSGIRSILNTPAASRGFGAGRCGSARGTAWGGQGTAGGGQVTACGGGIPCGGASGPRVPHRPVVDRAGLGSSRLGSSGATRRTRLEGATASPVPLNAITTAVRASSSGARRVRGARAALGTVGMMLLQSAVLAAGPAVGSPMEPPLEPTAERTAEPLASAEQRLQGARTPREAAAPGLEDSTAGAALLEPRIKAPVPSLGASPWAARAARGLHLAWVPAGSRMAAPDAPMDRGAHLAGDASPEASPASGLVPRSGVLLLSGLGVGDRFHVLWEPADGPPVHLLAGVARPGGSPRVALPTLEGTLVLVRGASGSSGSGFARLSLPARPRPHGSGEILITEFLRDPVAVSDSFGEWFEVFNSTNQPIDLEGWSLTDEGSDATVLDNGGLGIVVPARGYLVLGREVSPAFNGGALVHAEYQGFTLANGADEIVLRRPGGRLVDRVAYDSAGGWPGAPGASCELAQGRLGSTWNDDPVDWCTATSRMTGGDLGSPGVGNGPCP